jgi:glucose-1-phosphate thymidylyltransferase
MKVMILTAGLGTRLRPHTYSRPKPLLGVAGKPVLGHIIDDLQGIQIDELICITGYLGDQIEAFVRKTYSFPMRFIEQPEARGQAHAIHLARDYVEGPLLVVFGDGLLGLDTAHLNTHPAEGVIYCQEVDDPRRFGVAVVEDGRITRLVEKPSEPVSNLAVVGAYYFPEARRLMDAITYIIDKNIQTKGEFYLADALQVLIDRGEMLRPDTVSLWRDCGTVEALLDTNRYLLDHGHSRNGAVRESVIIPPVYIGEGAVIEHAIVGPHATIEAGAVVRNSIVQDSIVYANATLEGVQVTQSLVGEQAALRGAARVANVGARSEISIG